jgi:hypothetical protein
MSEPKEHEAESFYDLDSSRWLKEEHLQGKQVTLKIKKVKYVDTVDDDGKKKRETIIYFEKTDRHMGCNVTNRQCIRGMFGIKVKADWVGKRIVLFPTLTPVYNRSEKLMEDKPCIRIWGSPDITEDIVVTVTLAKKKPFKMTMHATGPKKKTDPQKDQPPPTDTAPPNDREPGQEG